MAIRRNADGSISVGILTEEKKAKVEAPTKAEVKEEPAIEVETEEKAEPKKTAKKSK